MAKWLRQVMLIQDNQIVSVTASTEIAALTALCVNNPELEQLESLLAEFNMFEAAGLTRDEVKHSRFLSFLLNPKESHGLGDAFLTRILQRAIQESGRDDLAVSPLELELWDLSDSEVRVEWSSIDLLVLNSRLKIAIVIENKIGSGEHSDQLNRYYSTINHWFPEWKILPLFLSPVGTPPSDDRFIPVTYEFVVEQLTTLLDSRGSGISVSVSAAISQYVQLLKRHVVSDSKVKELCQEIYRKHRKALELIYSHRIDEFGVAGDAIRQLLAEDDRFETDQLKGYPISFIPIAWKQWMPVSEWNWWAIHGYLMVFYIGFDGKGVRLILNRGPGDLTIAQRVVDAARSNKPPFDAQSKQAHKHWNVLYRRQLVAPATVQSSDFDKIISELEASWNQFLEMDLARMGEIMEAAVQEPSTLATSSDS